MTLVLMAAIGLLGQVPDYNKEPSWMPPLKTAMVTAGYRFGKRPHRFDPEVTHPRFGFPLMVMKEWWKGDFDDEYKVLNMRAEFSATDNMPVIAPYILPTTNSNLRILITPHVGTTVTADCNFGVVKKLTTKQMLEAFDEAWSAIDQFAKLHNSRFEDIREEPTRLPENVDSQVISCADRTSFERLCKSWGWYASFGFVQHGPMWHVPVRIGGCKGYVAGFSRTGTDRIYLSVCIDEPTRDVGEWNARYPKEEFNVVMHDQRVWCEGQVKLGDKTTVGDVKAAFQVFADRVAEAEKSLRYRMPPR
jgi:hypothetical protein